VCAQFIGSLPYTGNGSTVGYKQDYVPNGCSTSAQSSVQTAPVSAPVCLTVNIFIFL
jgi:hypothetical protein